MLAADRSTTVSGMSRLLITVPTVRPAVYGQMTQAGSYLTDLPQPDLEDSRFAGVGSSDGFIASILRVPRPFESQLAAQMKARSPGHSIHW